MIHIGTQQIKSEATILISFLCSNLFSFSLTFSVFVAPLGKDPVDMYLICARRATNEVGHNLATYMYMNHRFFFNDSFWLYARDTCDIVHVRSNILLYNHYILDFTSTRSLTKRAINPPSIPEGCL